jgi:hypothetical protein
VARYELTLARTATQARTIFSFDSLSDAIRAGRMSPEREWVVTDSKDGGKVVYSHTGTRSRRSELTRGVRY